METFADNGTWTVQKEKVWGYRKQGVERDRPHQECLRDHARNVIIHGILLFTISSQHNFPSPASPYPCFTLLQGLPSSPSPPFLVQPCSMSALICGYSHQVRACCNCKEPNCSRLKPEWSSFRSSSGALQRHWEFLFSTYLDSDFLSWPHLQWVRWPSAAPNLDIPLACYQPTLQLIFSWLSKYLLVLWPFQGKSVAQLGWYICSELIHSSQDTLMLWFAKPGDDPWAQVS